MTIEELIKELQNFISAGVEKNTPVYTVITDQGAAPINSIYTDATLGVIIDGYPKLFSSQTKV